MLSQKNIIVNTLSAHVFYNWCLLEWKILKPHPQNRILLILLHQSENAPSPGGNWRYSWWICSWKIYKAAEINSKNASIFSLHCEGRPSTYKECKQLLNLFNFLVLRSNKTKIHRHLNIEAFVSVNPCPKLIDILIWRTIERFLQMPVNTCVCHLDWSRVPKYWITANLY